MQWIESEVLTHKEKQQCPASGCLNFLDAFYYIVVTNMPLYIGGYGWIW
ncbi:hypothetical protein KC19_4G165700 [Ceratodon purpureus]|uniref:Uncharacterized protein n=1 Tax=Ceratodon purpureus TaxID=3225 RepID=A0A8T0IBG3_CERPU|nr:hypothetical protein KC19_4G165700 [Ceratodon purpureus]